jgi:HK97 family phage major capsid protein
MTRLQQLEQKRAALMKQMRAFLDADENKDSTWDEAQEAAYGSMKTELASIAGSIERENELRAEELAAKPIAVASADGTSRVTNVTIRAEADPQRGFNSHQDFLASAIAASRTSIKGEVGDDRLKTLAVDSDEGVAFMLPAAFAPGAYGGMRAAVGSDEQGEYDDRRGGFSVPTTVLPGMMQLGFEGDPTLGRTTAIPMETPKVSIMARTDKNHTSSVSGGFTVARRAEAVAAASSRMEMELIELSAHSLFGLGYATNELLTDSVLSFIAIISAGFRDQFPHRVFREKIRGAGGDQFLGQLTALDSAGLGPTIAVARETASRIVGTDVLAMRARCWGYGNAIWLANHDAFGELFRLGATAYDVGATPLSGANALYVSSMQEDRPDMLLGRPIFYSEYPSTLGSAGDLMLTNWAEFLEGTYQPIQSASSIHVRFVEHETTFKFWLRNAGAPWWRTPLTPEQSTTTLSPSVIIAA